MKIVSANFIKSGFKKADWPDSNKPEIAFAGRSNVGKSSLINSILSRNKLVKTSSTPGKTRSLNFFDINEKFIFTDLPGYGFARGNKDEVKKWKPMIEEYLSGREQLKALVHIVDIRRVPNELELMLAEWSREQSFEHIVVANKSDKLSSSASAKSLFKIEKILQTKPLAFSVLKKVGKKELWSKINSILK